MMKFRVWQMALIFVLLWGTVAAPARAQAPAGGYTAPVTGGVLSFVGQVGLFVGTLRITEFARQGDDLIAKGVIDGTISDGGRSTIGNVRREIALPVTSLSGDCDGVMLVFAPFDDLGPDAPDYTIQLDPISLDNRAQGSKLLGNFLCTIGRQLEHKAQPNALAALLNQVLRALGG
jgi:hypothetical protein